MKNSTQIDTVMVEGVPGAPREELRPLPAFRRCVEMPNNYGWNGLPMEVRRTDTTVVLAYDITDDPGGDDHEVELVTTTLGAVAAEPSVYLVEVEPGDGNLTAEGLYDEKGRRVWWIVMVMSPLYPMILRLRDRARATGTPEELLTTFAATADVAAQQSEAKLRAYIQMLFRWSDARIADEISRAKWATS